MKCGRGCGPGCASSASDGRPRAGPWRTNRLLSPTDIGQGRGKDEFEGTHHLSRCLRPVRRSVDGLLSAAFSSGGSLWGG